jgi:hypothetical protein
LSNVLDVTVSYFFEDMSAGVKAQSPAELIRIQIVNRRTTRIRTR